MLTKRLVFRLRRLTSTSRCLSSHPRKETSAVPFSKVKVETPSLRSVRAIKTSPRITEEEVVVERNDDQIHFGHEGAEYSLDSVWLRENCRCGQCFNHITHQRSLLVHHRDISTQTMKYTTSMDVLNVEWSDGHCSRYELSWLVRQLDTVRRFQNKVKKYVWNKAALLAELPAPSTYDDILSSDTCRSNGARYSVLKNILKYGFAFIDEIPATVEGTREVVERIAPVQKTLFGDMWTFRADGSRADTAYGNGSLGCHNDTAYLTAPIGLQIFHCLHHEGEGGDTLLVDGYRAIEAISSSDRSQLSRIRVEHVYFEDGYHMVARAPILSFNEDGTAKQIRYNVYDRRVSPDIAAQFYPPSARLAEHLELEENEFRVKLQPGRVLLVDNWRVLHGRTGFTGDREMCGCYVSRDDWMNSVRSMGLLNDAE